MAGAAPAAAQRWARDPTARRPPCAAAPARLGPPPWAPQARRLLHCLRPSYLHGVSSLGVKGGSCKSGDPPG